MLVDALHAGKPNHLVQLNFLYISPREQNIKYALLIKDDHASYILQGLNKTQGA